MRIQSDMLRSFDSQFNLSRLGAWPDNPVEFQFLPIAVENKVHTRIDIAVPHTSKIGNTRAPSARVIADEIVALPRQFFLARYLWRKIGMEETQP